MGTTILVGYVAKAEGRAALRRAAEESLLRDARLVVVTSSPAGEDGVAPVELDGVRRQLADAGIETEVRELRGSEVAEHLVSTAAETGADMIVIGLRRRSPVGKLLLGSNAQRILLDAPCPVLAVKAEEAQ